MALKCAVLDDDQQVASRFGDWERLGDRVEVDFLSERFGDIDSLVAAVAEHHVLVVMRERTPLTREVFERLPELELVVTSGRRNASIDVRAATEHGVVVTGTPSHSEPPAEVTWALILGLSRHVTVEQVGADEHWQTSVGKDLYGATLGLLGFGRIGRRVGRVGVAFGMQVVTWSPNLTEDRVDEPGVALVPRDELFARSDWLSVHLRLGETTRGLVTRADLEAMKSTACFVNTSRSGLVEDGALLDALRDGHIAGAGLDVFDTEPVPPGDALTSLPNVLALPHVGYVSERNYASYFEGAVGNIEAHLRGEVLRPLG